MKASELVGRLLVHAQQIRKARAGFMEVTPLSDDVKRAADLIEAQAKDIEELRDAVSHWMVADPKSFLNYTMNDVVRQVIASHSKEGEQG